MPVNASTSGEEAVTMLYILLVASYLSWYCCYALEMKSLDAPDAALQGYTIELSCFYSLEGSSNDHKNHANTYLSRASSGEKVLLPSGERFKSNSEERYLSQLPTAKSATFDNNNNNNSNSNSNSKQTKGDVALISEQLYAVKWYKDGREFFRYLNQDGRRKQAFTEDGIQVDLEKSDNHTVVLKNVSLKTSGLFKCEVSTDAPTFVTKALQRLMFIYSCPSEGPRIEPVNLVKSSGSPRLLQGEHIELLCLAPESKPAATLDWIINDNLNLSSPEWAHLRPLFQIKSQRFVRLRTSKGTATTVDKTHPAPSTLLYEVHNQTLIPVDNPSSSLPVNLPSGALDQLVETSTSKLSLSFQLLGQRIRTSHQTTGHKQPPSSNLLKLLNNSQSSGTSKKQMMLKVKCAARVLHLMFMSDEVKVNLSNARQLTKAESVYQIDVAQKERRIGRPVGRSSAIRVTLDHKFLIMITLFITTVKYLSF